MKYQMLVRRQKQEKFVKNNVSSVEALEKQMKEWEMRGKGASCYSFDEAVRVVRYWRVYGRQAMH